MKQHDNKFRAQFDAMTKTLQDHQERLKESEQRFHSVVENANSAVISADSNGNIIFWNKAAEKMFGYSAEEIINKPLTTIMPERYHRLHRKGLERITKQEKSRIVNRTIELSGLRKNGTEFPLDLSLATWSTVDGMFFTAMISDITERKQTEENLRYRIKLEELITIISINFINLPVERVDESINHALGVIGRFFNIDRSYIFLYSEDLNYMTNTHEWCNKGIQPQKERIQHLRCDKFPWFNRQMKEFKIVYAPDTSELPSEAEAVRKEWQAQQIQSIVCVPMVCRDNLIGFIGLDSVRTKRDFEDDIIIMLRILSEIFANAKGRLKAEKELRESETRLRDFFQNAPVGFHIFAPDRTIVDINDAELAMIGYSRDEIVGKKSWADLIRPEQREDFEEHWKDILTKGEVRNLEYTLVHKDGRYVDVTLNASARFDDTGNLISIRGSVLNITERKRADLALRMSEQRFRAIADYTYGWENWFSPQGTLLWVNSGVERITGYSVAECMSMPAFPISLVHEDDRDTLANAFRSALEGNSGDDLELRIHKKNGEIIWASVCWQPIYDKNGVSQGHRSSIRDITVRKQTELAIESIVKGTARTTGQDFLRSLVRQLASAIDCRYIMLGEITEPQASRIKTLAIWAKNDFAENFEYDLEGTPCGNVVGKKLCTYPENIQELFPNDSILTEMQAEGYIGIPLFDSSGKPLGLLAAIHDKPIEKISLAESILTIFAARAAAELERKHAEEERERLLEILAAKNEELESIMHVSYHDLRSPLVNIQGYSTELNYSCKQVIELLGEIKASEETKEKILKVLQKDIPDALEYIISGTNKIDMLLGGLLKLSRLGRTVIKIQYLDMNALVQDVINNMQHQINQSKVIVTVDKLPACLGDAGQVSQVFTNLLDNAVKYIDPVRKGKIKISGRVKKGNSIYSVKDNGIGIASEHQDRIFEIFHRLNPTGRVTGEGLGLTIIMRILNGHKGKIWVKSEPEKGSKFFVSLPTA